MKIDNIGLVDIEIIKNLIVNKFNLEKEKISFSFSDRDKTEVEASFSIQKKDKFKTIQNVKLEYNDILELTGEYLKKEDIAFKDLKVSTKHIPGDSFEPLDYGTWNFIGFNFTFLDSKKDF